MLLVIRVIQDFQELADFRVILELAGTADFRGLVVIAVAGSQGTLVQGSLVIQDQVLVGIAVAA